MRILGEVVLENGIDRARAASRPSAPRPCCPAGIVAGPSSRRRRPSRQGQSTDRGRGGHAFRTTLGALERVSEDVQFTSRESGVFHEKGRAFRCPAEPRGDARAPGSTMTRDPDPGTLMSDPSLGPSTPLAPPLYPSSVYNLPDLDALDRVIERRGARLHLRPRRPPQCEDARRQAGRTGGGTVGGRLRLRHGRAVRGVSGLRLRRRPHHRQQPTLWSHDASCSGRSSTGSA